jgi:hypothetical protein
VDRVAAKGAVYGHLPGCARAASVAPRVATDAEEEASPHNVAPLLGAWHRRAREAQFSHYAAAARYASLARWLGVPGVLLSATAGTTLFATLQEDASPTVRLAVGLISLLAATLAALQTFLAHAERADKHRAAAAAYGAIRRQIEQAQVLPPVRRAELEEVMTQIRRQLDDVARAAPDVPDRIRRRVEGDIRDTTRPHGFMPRETSAE